MKIDDFFKKSIEEYKKFLGIINYNAYRDAVGGKTWNGENMKDFDEMPDKIKNAWIKSAWEVLKDRKEEIKEEIQKLNEKK